MSVDPYALDALLQQPGEPWPRYLARIGVLFRTAPPVERTGAPRRDRSPLLACLTSDQWTTAEDVAARVGMGTNTVRQALNRACTRGAPIESRRGYGWRLLPPLAQPQEQRLLGEVGG